MLDTFGDLRARFDDLVGLDLEDTERDALLNEGHDKLATESEWYRATIELGPTVADQTAYDIPDDVFRILKVKVSGNTYSPSTDAAVEKVQFRNFGLNVPGLWWPTFSATNVEQVSIHPAPSTAGESILAFVVEHPAEMDDDADVPVVPKGSRNAIVDYASAIAFAGDEDNPDLRVFYEDRFEAEKMKLKQRRNMAGRAVRTFDVSGWTA